MWQLNHFMLIFKERTITNFTQINSRYLESCHTLNIYFRTTNTPLLCSHCDVMRWLCSWIFFSKPIIWSISLWSWYPCKVKSLIFIIIWSYFWPVFFFYLFVSHFVKGNTKVIMLQLTMQQREWTVDLATQTSRILDSGKSK